MRGVIVAITSNIDIPAEFYEAGSYDAAGFRGILQQAARLSLDTLVLDLACAPDAAILEGLHFFRMQRPGTRIIILAVGREPGDPMLAKIVAKGIYDVLTPEIEDDWQAVIEKALNSEPASYAEAARFVQDLDFSQNVQQQDVILQQRPLGLTTIAVGGAGAGAGTSHLCLALASYIGRAGHRVLVAEWPEGVDQGDHVSQYQFFAGCYKLKCFDCMFEARQKTHINFVFSQLKQKHYNFLILDLGAVDSREKIQEMDRAGLPVLVVAAAPTRYEQVIKFLKADSASLYAPNLANWLIALNLATETYYKSFNSAFGKHLGKIIPVPYFPDPLQGSDALLQNIIDPVLPVQFVQTKKPFLKNIFKK